MLRPESLIQRLEQAKADLATEALARPAGRDPFDYGRVVGIYEGLNQAKAIILAMVADREHRDFNL